jgi:hypothetical protein
MVCYISCGIALAFITASIYTMMTNNEQHKKLRDSFDDAGKKAYDKITGERLELYVKGSIAGLVLATGFFLWARKKLGTIPTVCSFIIIMFIVQIAVYSLTPKSDFVLNYVKSNEQSKMWLEVYNTMKNRYHIGFFIGLIGYGVLCYSFTQEKSFTF